MKKKHLQNTTLSQIEELIKEQNKQIQELDNESLELDQQISQCYSELQHLKQIQQSVHKKEGILTRYKEKLKTLEMDNDNSQKKNVLIVSRTCYKDEFNALSQQFKQFLKLNQMQIEAMKEKSDFFNKQLQH